MGISQYTTTAQTLEPNIASWNKLTKKTAWLDDLLTVAFQFEPPVGNLFGDDLIMRAERDQEGFPRLEPCSPCHGL